MYGPQILASFLETPGKPDKYGHAWQYNSQSDRHSSVGCWGIALDLMLECALLRQHAEQNKVVLGVNHALLDFEHKKEKRLDLVIAKPNGAIDPKAQTFKGLAHKLGIVLTDEVKAAVDSIPDISVGLVGATLIALEAKAAMTAHNKARPRLHNELSASQQIVHGAAHSALSIAYVQINGSKEFLSSVLNGRSWEHEPPEVSTNPQPKSVLDILEAIESLPRRSGPSGVGFDGIGVTVLDFENQGGPVNLITKPPAPQPGNAFHYDTMIVRMATEYASRFNNI